MPGSGWMLILYPTCPLSSFVRVLNSSLETVLSSNITVIFVMCFAEVEKELGKKGGKCCGSSKPQAPELPTKTRTLRRTTENKEPSEIQETTHSIFKATSEFGMFHIARGGSKKAGSGVEVWKVVHCRWPPHNSICVTEIPPVGLSQIIP